MVQVVFVHPDLGIGGAERLVIDAALALKKKGHSVSFITAHHNPNHCFPETIDGSLKVICKGDWLPRSTFGLMFALWAYIRMMYIAFYLTFFSKLNYEVVFVDQISACIPILRLKRNIKILFFCHYPDQLLTERKSILKTIYRYFIDKLEEITTKMADIILVNSKFTMNVFKKTFKSITVNPSVLYPSFDFSKFNMDKNALSAFDTKHKMTFLSLNRYERKKNVSLAIEAFHLLIKGMNHKERDKVHLVIAGGYDNRVAENKLYYNELVSLAKDLEIDNFVTFLKSPLDELKMSLLHQATCLLYTPSNEHFGIVPIESMYMGTPVIAVNTGGPTETVLDGETGFLREQNPEEFSSVMKSFVDGIISKADMSKTCHQHVVNQFSFEKFSNHLHYVVQGLVDGRKRR